MKATMLALVLVAAPAAAQDGAPETAVIPEARPESSDAAPEEQPPALIAPKEMAEHLQDEDADEPATPEGAAGEDATGEEERIGREEASRGDAPGEVAQDTEVEGEPGAPAMREALAETSEELATCLAELDRLNVEWSVAEPVVEAANPGCGIANPITVAALAPGVALEPPAVMRCATALAGARWVSDVVVPLSRKLGRGEVTAVDNGTAYQCRPRADGGMSEHAFGNALDVMGFRFSDGDPIPVQPRAGDGTLEEAFQRAVRAGACLDFATVLGPGSDADHADHLHLDVKQRDGAFRICE